MNIKSAINRLKIYFVPEEWCIALRINEGENNLIDDKAAPFTVIKNSLRYWAADPFLAKGADGYYIFFEMYDRLKRKGLIGYRKIDGKAVGKMHKAFEYPHHLSYPFIYEENGSFYIVPECNAGRELFRIKADSFPSQWHKEAVLLENARLTDTTIFDYENQRYYISQEIDDSYTFDKINLYYEQNGALIPCASNPVKRDIDTARCAGKIFEHNKKFIRPSQNCGESYGKELNFNEITEISKGSYMEKRIDFVSAESVKLNVKNIYTGIHTYNKLDNIEVIDLKLPDKPNLFNSLGVILKFIKRLLHIKS
ncbi:MAG: hypothetical protein ACI4IQ_01885 [Eubacterium sp.]